VTLTVRLYADFICPFCFVFEQGVVDKLLRDFDVRIDRRGVELDPEAPGFNLPGRLHLFDQDYHLRAYARVLGVDLQVPRHRPRTQRALAIAEFARDWGTLELFWRSAMIGYWREAKDLEHDPDLAAMALQSGMNPETALLASRDVDYLGRVETMRREAAQLGVVEIPSLVAGDELIVGCRTYDQATELLRRAGANRRA